MPLLRSIFAFALAALALVVVGCSSTPESAGPPRASIGEASFPRTVEHALGETTIPEKPKRVVTLSWMNHDIVAALGVAPVGVPETWGGDEEGFTPWFRDQVENQLKAEMPEIINVTEDGADYEQILALQPDVIIGVYSGFTETEYKRLSEIAPSSPDGNRLLKAATTSPKITRWAWPPAAQMCLVSRGRSNMATSGTFPQLSAAVPWSARLSETVPQTCS